METASNSLIECACGCGQTLDRFDSRGRERRFIHNHHANLQPHKRQIVTCENCGKQFERDNAHRLRVQHHFCNKDCEGAWSSKVGRRRGENNGHYNTIEVACAGGCGTKVRKAASLINRRNGNVYCPDCIEFVKREREGSYASYPAEFTRSLRKQIRERDHHTCQNCDQEQKHLGYTLHVHHIDYDKKTCDHMNLISLCRDCHGSTLFGTEQWREKFQSMMALRFRSLAE